jgi:hypothetical protein
MQLVLQIYGSPQKNKILGTSSIYKSGLISFQAY